jgi:hypothetical protein
MIHEAKGYYYESGIAALVYGFTIFICSVLSWLNAKDIIAFPFQPFYLLIPIFFVQSFIQMREEKKKKAKTFTDETIDHVWMGFFLAVFAACTAAFAGYSYIIISIVLILTGLAAFLTGMITKFKYHIVVSFIVWVIAAVSFFFQNERSYFLLAASAILVWIIPGFMLNANFRKLKHT